ncbi:pre-mRNA cleavage and polyadenylation factor (CPF) complex subunit [Ascosphaera pollenicola]|nr:pre-mRNA cleavage and polyadenylation factor (CPF) complex subunit [Ascosphaera pollenicola]
MQLMMEKMGYQQPAECAEYGAAVTDCSDKRKRDEEAEIEGIKEQKRRCVGDGVAKVEAATTAPVDVPEQKHH